MSFFSSRWVDQPAHVTDAADSRLPKGFRAAGVAAGIKPSGGLDVGLMVCDSPEGVSAARFTASGVLAAPVLVTQQRSRLDALRAVAVNSGNANAATGGRGMDEAAKMQGAAGMASRVPTDQVAVASTGVIGVQLDGHALVKGLLAANAALGDSTEDFAGAIMTTDVLDKRAELDVELPSGTVRLTAQAKGAGMIEPRFATMLCFVQTDAAIGSETADLLLGVTVKRSFERISVDGQLSTNDTVILQASGASGVVVLPESQDELLLGEALDALLRQLAMLIISDGEGAARTGRVVVRGGDPEGVDRVARAIANSPLVKTALHGADPNWGRIAQAVGAAMLGTAPLVYDIAIEGVQVCNGGNAVRLDPGELPDISGPEIEYEVDLPGDGAEAEVFFSDFGHGYITINAEYTT